jgi:transcriptional regulator with XRE-family HTH domain
VRSGGHCRFRQRVASIPSQGIGRPLAARLFFSDEPVASAAALACRGGRSSLGRLLKEWRGRRGYSQLALAARTTQRHLSFIESGRAAPSRDMILRQAATMDLPLRQQNALLLAAGYAPAWRERDLSAPGLEVVNRALDYMLAQHAISRVRCRPALEPAARQPGRAQPDRVPNRSGLVGASGRTRQPRDRVVVAEWTAAVHRQ